MAEIVSTGDENYSKVKLFWKKNKKLFLIISIPIFCSILPLIFRNKVIFKRLFEFN